MLEPLPGSVPESTTQAASSQEAQSFIDDLKEMGIDGTPDSHCIVKAEVEPDDTLSLDISAFSVNGYPTSVKIPFSDFSENCTCITDLKRLLVDTVYSQSVGSKEACD